MRRPRRARALLASFVLLAVLTASTPLVAQEEWPGFRGSTAAGIAEVALDTRDLAPHVAWRAGIGIGYSGVTVADGRAITLFEDGEQFMVAFDAATGAELWRRPVGPAYPGRDGSWNGPISTPLVRDNLVVALTPWGRLFALDTTDGEPVWSVHLAEELGAPRPVYGFASSPLLVGDTLVVHGGPGAGALLGLDVATGERRWSVGDEVVDSQSPVAMNLAGVPTVVASGEQHVFGIAADSGEVLWQYAHGGDGYRGQASLVPVALENDRIFLAHSDNSSQVIAVRSGAEGWSVEQVWQERTIRNSYTVPVHHEGYLYAYSARILVCVDAATGEPVWRSRPPGDGFLTRIGDELVILTKDGSLHVIEASPEGYRERASAVVFDELTWTPPSFAYGSLFARSLDEIVRIDLHGSAAATAVADAVRHNVPRSLPPGEGELGRLVAALATADDPEPVVDAFFERNPRMPLIEDERRALFVYRGDDEVMAIAGDFVGSRQEAPMERIGDSNVFYYVAEIDPTARVNYVLVRENETIPDPRNPRQVETFVFDADREFSFGGPLLAMSEVRMPRWEEPAHLREPSPDTPRGTLETLELDSPFGPATFSVYLPAGYGESEARYPVLYVHGRAPASLSMLPRSLDNLIADGMGPVIAVYAEGFLPPAPPYNAFWADTLVPAIDERYRTIASAEGRIGVGGALGTLQALFIAFAYPEMTSAVGLQTLFFLDSDWDALRPLLRPAAERPLRIYVDWGMYDVQNPQEAWDGREMSRAQWAELESLGFELHGGERPDGTGWASWRNRIDEMLEALLPQEPAR